MIRDVTDQSRRQVGSPRLDSRIVHHIEGHAESEEGADNLVARRIVNPNPRWILMDAVKCLKILAAQIVVDGD